MDFMWRCAKCSNHFSNITETGGVLKQEKKCPKCKSLNELSLNENEIHIHCRPQELEAERFYPGAEAY